MRPQSLRVRGRHRAATPSRVLPLTASKAKALDHSCARHSSPHLIRPPGSPWCRPSSPTPRLAWAGAALVPAARPARRRWGYQLVVRLSGAVPVPLVTCCVTMSGHLPPFCLTIRPCNRDRGGPYLSGGWRFNRAGWGAWAALGGGPGACARSPQRGPFRSCLSHRTSTWSFPSTPRTGTRHSNPSRTDRSLPGRL